MGNPDVLERRETRGVNGHGPLHGFTTTATPARPVVATRTTPKSRDWYAVAACTSEEPSAFLESKDRFVALRTASSGKSKRCTILKFMVAASQHSKNTCSSKTDADTDSSTDRDDHSTCESSTQPEEGSPYIL